MVQPVYLHAVHQLRIIEHAAQNARSRSRAVRPELPELPIPLNAEPCVSMILHPGRLITSADEPPIRIAIVSMLVRDALPDEIPVSVRVMPWEMADDAGGGGGAASAEASKAVEPVITFSIYRDEVRTRVACNTHTSRRLTHTHTHARHTRCLCGPARRHLTRVTGSTTIPPEQFTQEGPSGPIEAKRILLVRALPLTRTRVVFEIDQKITEQLGFCITPPLMIEHRHGVSAATEASNQVADVALRESTPIY